MVEQAENIGSLDLYTHAFAAMGTRCELRIYAPDRASAGMAFAGVLAEVERIERKYSRYDPASVVSEINRVAAAGSIELDAETAALIDHAFACHTKSDGLFDITAGVLRHVWDFKSGRLPESGAVEAILPRIGLDKLDWKPPSLSFRVPGIEIDLGGIGKEYAVDRAAQALLEAGIEYGLVDFGGDIAVIGPLPNGEPWRIGLRDPREGTSLAGEAAILKGALATSGDYERCIEIGGKRYGHILDPRTGWPVEGLASVTVLAESCLLAGSVATIAMLRGRAGGAWLKSLDLPYLSVDVDGRLDGILPAVFEAS
jgi:thiamine biosynthesis lipoprotein